MGTWRVTEPAAKPSSEIGIVAKAACVSDLANGLACVQQGPALQEACGVIQSKRMYEMTAGRVPHRKELLKVA